MSRERTGFTDRRRSRVDYEPVQNDVRFQQMEITTEDTAYPEEVKMVKQSELILFIFVMLTANIVGFICAIVSLNQSKHLIGVEALRLGIVSISMHAIGLASSLIVTLWICFCGVRVG